MTTAQKSKSVTTKRLQIETKGIAKKTPKQKHSTLIIDVAVPLTVNKKNLASFEKAFVEFFMGYDRVRPEIENLLTEQGVDVKKLASLSKPEKLGLCVSPRAFEFAPSLKLKTFAKNKGLDLSSGGKIEFKFLYDKKGNGDDEKELTVNFRLPALEENLSEEITGEIVQSLFGNCELPEKAENYLNERGINLTNLAARLAKFNEGEIPPTTRVSEKVASVLNDSGFNTEIFGKLKVTSIFDIESQVAAINPLSPVMWEKSTCC